MARKYTILDQRCNRNFVQKKNSISYTYKHTHTYIYIYIYYQTKIIARVWQSGKQMDRQIHSITTSCAKGHRKGHMKWPPFYLNHTTLCSQICKAEESSKRETEERVTYMYITERERHKEREREKDINWCLNVLQRQLATRK